MTAEAKSAYKKSGGIKKTKMHSNRVCILDAGAQYGGLIDRNIRELGIRTELLPLETLARDLTDFDAVVISGGPSSVNEPGSPDCDPAIFDLNKPVLGICYGLQLLAKHLGGRVGTTNLREDGPQATSFFGGSKLLAGLEVKPQNVLMSHGDSVIELPTGFRVVGRHDQLISVIEDAKNKLYGTQFHPEVFQTEGGKQIFENFLFGISDLKADYSPADQEQEAINYIKKYIGNRDVTLFLSGGVDSTVLAALMAKCLNKSQVHAFHIDTGFMREGESQAVMSALKQLGIKVKLLDKAQLFYKATTTVDGIKTAPLNQVRDPQLKRKIIGDTFAAIHDDLISSHGLADDTVLAQGSLRPDLIESGSHLASTKADIIKTHHNDTEAVRRLRSKNRVVEPLQQLYKDQVRQLGRRLGLPESVVNRHPFPGPGLAIRIICANEPYRLKNHDNIQASLDKFLLKEGYSDYRSYLLPVRTVGVQGDGRSYKYLVGLTGKPNWPRLIELANKIPGSNHDVNRVCYIFGDVDPKKINITPTLLTPDSIGQVRRADAIVTKILSRHNLLGAISQMPVVLLPVNFDQSGHRAIALRPFKTPDFMTGLAARPGRDIPIAALSEMVETIIKEVVGISRVVYDLSSKPPGTTEWE